MDHIAKDRGMSLFRNFLKVFKTSCAGILAAYSCGDADESSGVFGASSGRGDFSTSEVDSRASGSGCELIFKMPTGVVQRMAVGLIASSVTPSVSLEPA
jgi:hypothetical protein